MTRPIRNSKSRNLKTHLGLSLLKVSVFITNHQLTWFIFQLTLHIKFVKILGLKCYMIETTLITPHNYSSVTKNRHSTPDIWHISIIELQSTDITAFAVILL